MANFRDCDCDCDWEKAPARDGPDPVVEEGAHRQHDLQCLQRLQRLHCLHFLTIRCFRMA